MRNLFLKSMVFVMALSLAVNFTCADDKNTNFETAVANETQKREVKEQSEEKLVEIKQALEINLSDLKKNEEKLTGLQTALSTAMKALTGAGSNNFFTAADAKEGDLSKALDQFLKRKKLLSATQLKANEGKIDALENAINDLRILQSAINNLKSERGELEKSLKAIEAIPAVLDQEDDLKIKEDETNKEEKNKELVDLTEKIIILYESNESVINTDPENDFTNLATLIQIYSKNIKEMKETDSIDTILSIGKELNKERDEFLKKLGRKSGRTISDVRFGTVDANFNSIQASQAYQQIFKAIDADLTTIEESKDVLQISRAYKAVQLGLLGIKKMEDAREFRPQSGSRIQTTIVPSSSYYGTSRLDLILNTNSKDLKYLLKQRRKNIRLYYKYR